MPQPGPANDRAAVARRELSGVWDVEGDRYVVEPSSEGGVVARSELGERVNPFWIALRGRKLSDDPADFSESN